MTTKKTPKRNPREHLLKNYNLLIIGDVCEFAKLDHELMMLRLARKCLDARQAEEGVEHRESEAALELLLRSNEAQTRSNGLTRQELDASRTRCAELEEQLREMRAVVDAGLALSFGGSHQAVVEKLRKRARGERGGV